MSLRCSAPNFFWGIIAVPIACLIFSLAGLVVTYSIVLHTAKNVSFTVAGINIALNNANETVNNLIHEYDGLIHDNELLKDQINQLKPIAIQTPSSSSSPTMSSKYNVTNDNIPKLMDSLDRQQFQLRKQKEKLEDVSKTLQGVKHEFKIPDSSYNTPNFN